MSQNDKVQKVIQFLIQKVALPVWFIGAVVLAAVIYAIASIPGRVKPTQTVNAESYAVGFALGKQLTPVKEQINPDIVARGVRHGINTDEKESNAELSAEDRLAALSRIQNRQAQVRQQSADEQLKKSNEFLASIKAKPSARELEPGLLIEPIGETKGPLAQAKEHKVVTLVFEAKRIDGTTFDKSPDTGVDVKVESLIPGLRKALARMPEGARWSVYIAPNLAFGPSPTPALPAQSAVAFDVKLLKVKQ